MTNVARNFRLNMFRSARVKLTVFYLAILLVFSLTLTTGIRIFAERELRASNDVQRTEIRDFTRSGLGLLLPHPESDFEDVQRNQTDIARQHLNRDLVLLNMSALVVGGFLSYWFAGRTLAPIRRAHETQARFAADASHELRTPLANMSVENAVFLRQKKFTDAEARELIESNLEEVQRLESLSSNLLALTQYGQTELPMSDASVQDMVDDAANQSEKTLQTRQIKIAQKLECAKVHINAESVTRLLVILLDNAVKYGPANGTVYIAGARHGNSYVLTVRDEGAGIADKDLPHIFDRLYRGDSARTRTKASGYGLGLALAREIARANYAEITAYSHAHGGAVFSLELPLAGK
jgi:signal transduction histidine kinase